MKGAPARSRRGIGAQATKLRQAEGSGGCGEESGRERGGRPVTPEARSRSVATGSPEAAQVTSAMKRSRAPHLGSCLTLDDEAQGLGDREVLDPAVEARRPATAARKTRGERTVPKLKSQMTWNPRSVASDHPPSRHLLGPARSREAMKRPCRARPRDGASNVPEDHVQRARVGSVGYQGWPGCGSRRSRDPRAGASGRAGILRPDHADVVDGGPPWPCAPPHAGPPLRPSWATTFPGLPLLPDLPGHVPAHVGHVDGLEPDGPAPPRIPGGDLQLSLVLTCSCIDSKRSFPVSPS
jgi:hypothetical protein